MTRQVVISMPFPDDLLDRVRGVSPDVNVVYLPLKAGESLPADVMASMQVLYTWMALPRPEEAPLLRWVQFHSAGIDHVQGHPLLDADVVLTTTSGIHAPELAEYVLALVLAWTHRVPRMLAYQGSGIWPSGRWAKFVPQPLRGATMGIVGYGSLGREVARQAHAFGMKVLATKRDTRQVLDEGYTLPGTGDPKGELPERIYPSAALHSMLAQCDVVVLTAPLTAQTRHVINEEALKACKPGAFLVNVSRGGLVDEAALIKGLQKGWIAGAGLDVFEVEPLPAESPLWKMDNVILSPHVAGFTPHYDWRAIDVFARNLRRFVEGRALMNVVSKKLGY